jgi:hypothetical protein
MKSKYKPLPRSTKFIVEFHDGIHSSYTTKGDIIKMTAFHGEAMTMSLLNALDKLEYDRIADFKAFGCYVRGNVLGYVIGNDGVQRTYTLDLAKNRIGSKV